MHGGWCQPYCLNCLENFGVRSRLPKHLLSVGTLNIEWCNHKHKKRKQKPNHFASVQSTIYVHRTGWFCCCCCCFFPYFWWIEKCSSFMLFMCVCVAYRNSWMGHGKQRDGKTEQKKDEWDRGRKIERERDPRNNTKLDKWLYMRLEILFACELQHNSNITFANAIIV